MPPCGQKILRSTFKCTIGFLGPPPYLKIQYFKNYILYIYIFVLYVNVLYCSYNYFMRNADISYLCTYLCPNWLPRTAWSFNAIMSGLGSEHTLRLPLEFENDRHPIPDLAHFFHKNISHTTKLPHHHAQLPCTLCKPVV